MLRLADYSRTSLAELRAETGIAYDERMQGTLQLFRTQQQLDASGKDVKALAADRIPYEVLDRDGCIRAEPALAHVREKISGGLLTPKDETGDCFKFTNLLARKVEDLGVQFLWRTEINGLDVETGRVRAVLSSRERMRTDAVVVALGSYSPILLKPLGIRLNVFPVKGYSLTIPIRDASRAPESTVMDETYKIAITRLGDRIRVGGTAEISGYTNDLREPRRRTLENSVMDLFPGGDPSEATFWSGLRPMTPDGTPVIGPTKIAGLYLNTGHGTLGWTMSSGSARIISDLVSGRSTEVDASDLALSRYDPPH
jgi:D-amino-acid dehydrogenase